MSKVKIAPPNVPEVTFGAFRFVKKMRLELVIFAVIISVTVLLLPKEALVGLFSLLASKVLTLTIGVLLAHLLRVVAFSYIDLSDLIDKKNIAGVLFVASWYFIIIYAVAVGG